MSITGPSITPRTLLNPALVIRPLRADDADHIESLANRNSTLHEKEEAKEKRPVPTEDPLAG